MIKLPKKMIGSLKVGEGFQWSKFLEPSNHKTYWMVTKKQGDLLHCDVFFAECKILSDVPVLAVEEAENV